MKQPFIIAEIGINHNGDLKIAKELIDWAAQSGADAVLSNGLFYSPLNVRGRL